MAIAIKSHLQPNACFHADIAMFSINRILNSTFSTRTKTLAPAPSHPQALATNRFLPDGCLSLMCLPHTHTSASIAHKQVQTLPCEKNQPIACTSNTHHAQIDIQKITPTHFSANIPLNLCIRNKNLSPQAITLNAAFIEQNDTAKREKGHPLTPKQKQALKHGLQHPDGSPNLTALDRYRKQKTALKRGFTLPDGLPNVITLRRCQKQKTALNRGFTFPDGLPDVIALTRHQRKNMALSVGLTHPDGSPNLPALTRHQKQKTALKRGFTHPDGSPNLTALVKHQKEKTEVA